MRICQRCVGIQQQRLGCCIGGLVLRARLCSAASTAARRWVRHGAVCGRCVEPVKGRGRSQHCACTALAAQQLHNHRQSSAGQCRAAGAAPVGKAVCSSRPAYIKLLCSCTAAAPHRQGCAGRGGAAPRGPGGGAVCSCGSVRLAQLGGQAGCERALAGQRAAQHALPRGRACRPAALCGAGGQRRWMPHSCAR